MEACGQPLRILRESGEVQWRPFRCEHRFCTDCARRYSWKVASALNETFDSPEVYMLTLTQRLPSGFTADQLEKNWEIIGEHWKRATERARRHCKGVRKRKAHESDEKHATDVVAKARAKHWRKYWDKALNPEAMADNNAGTGKADGNEGPEHGGTAALPYLGTAYSRTWNHSRDEYDAPENLTYVWVREVTRGDSGQWHVHMHVVCPDRATAEVLNAAWQATKTQAETCRTDIKAPEDVRDELEEAEGDDDVRALAEYVTKYVTGARDGAFTDDWSTGQRSAYVKAMADKRVYDAAGDWRPIGLRNEAEADDPAVAVAWSDLDVWESFAEFWGDDSTVREAMTVAASNGWVHVPEEADAWAPVLEPARKKILEQHRNISAEPPQCIDVDALENGPDSALRGGLPPVVGDDP